VALETSRGERDRPFYGVLTSNVAGLERSFLDIGDWPFRRDSRRRGTYVRCRAGVLVREEHNRERTEIDDLARRSG